MKNKLAPKLRMFRNGDREVNAYRSELNPSVCVKTEQLASLPTLRQSQQRSAPPRAADATSQPRLPIEQASSEVLTSVFVEMLPGQSARDVGARSVQGELGLMELTLDRLREVEQQEHVIRVETGERIVYDQPLVGDLPEHPQPDRERDVAHGQQHGYGVNCLIGIIDVGGFDFAHTDFVVDGKTRFLSIWDQGGTTRPGGVPYGSLITAEHMNQAIAKRTTYHLPATELERQSQMVIGSHATHVASIAAGNAGVCRKADIAAVLLSLPSTDYERRRSFYDSTRIADAVSHLLAIAETQKKPISINISLGTNGHAHDASSALCRWVDHALASPGRCICVAAGNAGQDQPRTPEDIAFVAGRIHAEGRIPATELSTDLEWIVIGDGTADLSENELEIWYAPQDRFAVQVRPPRSEWLRTVQPGQFVENLKLPSNTFLSIYNELYDPSNGCNRISVYLSPHLKPPIVGVQGEPGSCD